MIQKNPVYSLHPARVCFYFPLIGSTTESAN